MAQRLQLNKQLRINAEEKGMDKFDEVIMWVLMVTITGMAALGMFFVHGITI
jgi:hypothetical protein